MAYLKSDISDIKRLFFIKRAVLIISIFIFISLAIILSSTTSMSIPLIANEYYGLAFNYNKTALDAGSNVSIRDNNGTVWELLLF